MIFKVQNFGTGLAQEGISMKNSLAICSNNFRWAAQEKDAVLFGPSQKARSCLSHFVGYIPAVKMASDMLFLDHPARVVATQGSFKIENKFFNIKTNNNKGGVYEVF